MEQADRQLAPRSDSDQAAPILSAAPARWLMYVLVFALAAMWSGSLFGVPVKHILTALLLLLTLPCMPRELMLLRRRRPMLLGYLVCSFALGIWTLVGLARGHRVDWVLTESLLVLVTPVLVLVYFTLVDQGRLDGGRLVRAAIYGLMVFAGGKLAMNVLTVAGVIDIYAAFRLLGGAFGIEDFVTGPIWPRGFFRLHWSNDTTAAAAVGLAIILRRYRPEAVAPTRLFVFLVVALAGIYVGFSRYLWFLAAMSLFSASWLCYRSLFRPRNVAIAVACGAVALMILPGAAAGLDELRGVFEQRFFSDDVRWSDAVRGEQMDLFPAMLERHWLVGWGWGSHIPQYIRNLDHPWGYEMQIPSYTFKLGALGFFVFFMSLVFLALDIWGSPAPRPARIYLLLLYLGLLASAFTNPAIATSAYGLILILVFTVMQQACGDATVPHRLRDFPPSPDNLS